MYLQHKRNNAPLESYKKTELTEIIWIHIKKSGQYHDIWIHQNIPVHTTSVFPHGGMGGGEATVCTIAPVTRPPTPCLLRARPRCLAGGQYFVFHLVVSYDRSSSWESSCRLRSFSISCKFRCRSAKVSRSAIASKASSAMSTIPLRLST
jgi:hypothetical protein